MMASSPGNKSRPEHRGRFDSPMSCVRTLSNKHHRVICPWWMQRENLGSRARLSTVTVGTGLKEQQFCRFSEQRPIGGDAVKNSIAVSISEKKMKTLGSNFLKF